MTNSKSEGRNPKETRTPKTEDQQIGPAFRNSGFVILSSFVPAQRDHSSLPRVFLRALGEGKDRLLGRHLLFEQRDFVGAVSQRQSHLPAFGHGAVKGRHDFKALVGMGKTAGVHLPTRALKSCLPFT